MKHSRRIVLFGAAGAGLALAVGLAHRPPTPREPPPVAARMVSESGSTNGVASPASPRETAEGKSPPSAMPAGSRPFSPPQTPLAESQQVGALPTSAPSAPLPPFLVVDDATIPIPALAQSAVAMPVSPQYGQLPLPAGESKKLIEAYEMLRQQLGGAGAAPERVPAPVPAANPGPVGGATSSSAALPSKATIDAEGNGKLSIHIQNADLREVLDLLGEQGGLNILAGTSVQGKVSATLNGVDIQSALDAILKSTGYVARREGAYTFVGTPDEFTALEQSLDRIGTRVYRPNYVTASELQKLIQPILTERIGICSVTNPAEIGIGSDPDQAGGDTFAGSEAVLVRDYEAVLAMVDQIVAEIDIRPLQVHIKAMILSVKLKDTDRYGVDFELLRNKNHVRFGWGAPEQTLANFKFEEGALKFGFLDSSLGAFLDALETIGDTNVIANPRLMVLNKHRAEIQIGEQKGYVSTTVTETASTQSVQFLDIGALLRLRPFISTDGMIRMEIHPELSDGSVKTDSGFTLPEKEVTQVTTNIMIRDGCTVVIGGLMRENLVTTAQQVPVLGNLPYLGFVFRSSTQTTERREVLVLITPHIVYEPETCIEGEQAACEFYRRQSLYADKMCPLNKRSIGRRYFRLAQSAWAVGDRNRALRFAEMAVQFDPLNRAAIDLRSDIWLGRTDGPHCLQTLVEQPAEALVDGPEVADWVLDELSAPPAAVPMPQHPLDPGQPGRSQNIERPRRLQ
ncbi:MAG: secretin N-terminal domain-containing protein [Planctomycetota bacterium]